MTVLGLALSVFLQHHQGGPHGFADAERWAQEFESPERLAWQKPDEVVAALFLRPGQRVADIGAGSGYFSRRFARAVGPEGVVYAVDIEPNMLRYIAARAQKDSQPNVVTVLGAPSNPMLAPGSVDLIFICNTVHHIEERPAYYEVLKRDLAPGGRLAVVDFEKREGIPVGPPLEMRLGREELVAELAGSGFRLKQELKLLPHQYFLVFEPEE